MSFYFHNSRKVTAQALLMLSPSQIYSQLIFHNIIAYHFYLILRWICWSCLHDVELCSTDILELTGVTSFNSYKYGCNLNHNQCSIGTLHLLFWGALPLAIVQIISTELISDLLLPHATSMPIHIVMNYRAN